MSYRRLGLMFGLLGLVLDAGTALAYTNYAFTALNTGGLQAKALAVNTNGNIVGMAYSPGGTASGCTQSFYGKPFIIKGGVLTFIGQETTARCLDSVATHIAINNSDVVVGALNDHGYRFQSGVKTDLHSKMRTDTSRDLVSSVLEDINDAGKMVGYAVDSANAIHGLYYGGTTFTVPKPGISGQRWVYGTALNSSGASLFRVEQTGTYVESLLYANSAFTSLPGFTSPTGSYYPVAYDLNNLSHSIGYHPEHGVFFHNGSGPNFIGMYPESFETNPMALNNNDVIVGNAKMGFEADNRLALLREGNRWVDLNTRVMPSGWRLLSANGVNDSGVIVGHALYTTAAGAHEIRAFKLTPTTTYASSFPQVYYRGTTNNNAPTPMALVGNNTWQIDVESPGGPEVSFAFDISTNWSNYYGDNEADGVADVSGADIFFGATAGAYRIVWNDVSKAYTIAKSEAQTSLKRTVVFMYGQTVSGQNMFMRGGIDSAYAKNTLNRDCAVDRWLCAIPITHRYYKPDPNRDNDHYLDWKGWENGQATGIQGSPLMWTTNQSTYAKTVQANGAGYTPLNTWGPHYWMLDVMMDCSKGVKIGSDYWFELKSFISNGPGWEGSISQAGTPYKSGNHFAKCGFINRFSRNSGAVLFLPLN